MTIIFRKKNKCPVCGTGGVWKYSSRYENLVYKFNKCQLCEVIFIDRIPNQKDIVGLYDDDYSGYSNLGFFTKCAQYIAKHAKQNLVRRYLGCGRILKAVEVGPGLNPMLMINDRIDKLIYIDLEHQRLRNAYGSNIEFVGTQDASGALSAINECDLIVANQLIEHLLDPYAFMINCYRSLKDGGLLFLETPNFDSKEFEFFGELGFWGGFHTPKHFNILSKKSIIKLAEKSGFKVVCHAYIYSPFLWSESFGNYLKSKGFPYLFRSLFSIKNPVALGVYLLLDTSLLFFGKNTSNQRVILRK